MQTTIEAKTPQPVPDVDLLIPLHVDYGMPVPNAFTMPGTVTFDEHRQITLVDGIPIIESGLVVRMGVTSSDVVSDGKKGAVDTGQPDDATPNA